MHAHHTSQVDDRQTLVGVSFDDSFRAQELRIALRGLGATGRLKLKGAVTLVGPGRRAARRRDRTASILARTAPRVGAVDRDRHDGNIEAPR